MRGRRNPQADIDLGLAVSALSLRKGQTRSFTELAAYCGVEKSAIQAIYEKAMHKLRRRYCGRAGTTLDHVVPIIRGGGHDEDNLVVACRPCNSRKKDKPLETFLCATQP